ncbi:diacylglycerol kinase family protein [Paenibacillus larvae]|uniref:Diacylglycerol kinase n=3 Tax=Paenibacillus larvae TaxID=1464 RepID=A0A6C0QW10_9BACL|nr:diacylglycerol kinase family protein [Paenibacillus larvae]AQR77370.1 hypothetical protein BXP28_08410 [Paenibacillus larvae subsp. larvae]AVF21625.1 diacylglycerol kinase [Paenibacillus larvae subsp. larvae]ETK27682.1 diacylglycerol kinase [Paenibacillus larvae subsp. larvae DSM 25719]MCY7490671.1 diacylglycerol kinase family protein [Paenibacillus larvae]MCY9564305.1 diacylglycerol kinase family protein [Paenibacillus larvae]
MNTVKRWIRGFGYAYEGILYALLTQRNMKFHFTAAFLVILVSLLLRLSNMKWILIYMSILLVIALELVNTAIEKTIDLVTPEYHPLTKVAKDTAAGAVLAVSILAMLTGTAVLGKAIWERIETGFTSCQKLDLGEAGGLVLLSWLILCMWDAFAVSKQGRSMELPRPHGFCGIGVSLSVVLGLYTVSWPWTGMALIITAIIQCSIPWLRRTLAWKTCLFGILAGLIVPLGGYWLTIML